MRGWPSHADQCVFVDDDDDNDDDNNDFFGIFVDETITKTKIKTRDDSDKRKTENEITIDVVSVVSKTYDAKFST